LALPASASAKIVELGQLADGVHGACPATCQAISHTTGYQAKVGPDRTVFQAPSDGRIVAWTVALGKPGPKQTAFFTERLGGVSQAGVVVLAPDKKLVRRVIAKSPMQTLTDYFGQVAQFPLTQTLPIRKGQYVGLTVPSWAPILQLGIGADTSWRASRATKLCNDPSVNTMQTALVGSRRSTAFECLYKTVRLTYSATFISTPASTADTASTTTPKTATTTTPKTATTTTPK
jgi:hypothetical protein